MSNGFEINISESEFKAKDKDDQTWILFQGVVIANKCIAEIDTKGCEFSKKKHKNNLIGILSAMSGTVVVALGAIYIVYQMICK